MPTATISLDAMYDAFWDRITGFSFGGASVATILTSVAGGPPSASPRLYHSVPNQAVYPYALMALSLPRTREVAQISANFFLEIMVFGRPRSAIRQVRQLGDLIQGGLRGFLIASSTDGLIRVTQLRRDAIPQGTGDVDATVVQERHVAEGFCYPRYLTDIPS